MFDQVVIAFYISAIPVIGLLAGKKTQSFRDFAIGKRNVSTFVLLSAIMASLVDASETLDYASEVLTEGLIYCIAYLGAGFASLFLAFFLSRKFSKFLGKAFSTGDVIETFFGRGAKIIIGIATFIETILFCGTQILAISITMQHFFGVTAGITSILVAIVTCLYYLRGGARSVNATDVIQFVIIAVLLPVFSVITLAKIGGYSTIASLIDKNGFNFTSSDPASNGKCLAMFIIFSLPGQYPLIIQRMLMAKNTAQLKNALIFHAVIDTLLRVLVILIGIAAFIVLPDSNPVFASLNLIDHLIPTGFKGFAIVGILAITMSTIDSTLHLGAVAFTQDIINSICKRPLNDKKKLKIARYSSIPIILTSVIVSLTFRNIGDVFYLLMALGNSLFWPGVFLGLTEISSSKKGFWMGCIFGFSSVIFCILTIEIDLLYLNLIGVSANLCAHIIYAVILEKDKITIKPLLNYLKEKISSIQFLDNLFSLRLVRNEDYCNIFAILSILLGIYPFFLINKAITFDPAFYMLLIFNSITSTLAIGILFAELWKQRFSKLYPILWAGLLVLALPTQTYFMIIYTGYSLIWIIDACLIILLIATLSTKLASLLFHIVGIMIAILANIVIGPINSNISNDFGYWTILSHCLTFALCLVLLRKRDIETCRYIVATLVHETKRALSTFETSANYYKQKLPILIQQYQMFSLTAKEAISPSDLNTMSDIPIKTLELSDRMRNILNKFYNQIDSYSNGRIFTKDCNIENCIRAAISDPTLDKPLRNYIFFSPKNELIIKGDHTQLVQVFINILENACHALDTTENPRIDIAILGQTVFITDNGKGLCFADIPNIFDEFFSTKSSSGQGLAFCKRAMIEHGGSIICSSKKNEFTCFELQFPARF